MGEPNGGLQAAYAGPLPRAKKIPISVRCRPGLTLIQAGVGGRKTDAMSLKEIDRLKSNCSAESSVDALHMVQCLPPQPCLCVQSLDPVVSNPCLELLKRIIPSCDKRHHQTPSPTPTMTIRLEDFSESRERKKTCILARTWGTQQ